MRSFDHGTWLLTSESSTLVIGQLLIGISSSPSQSLSGSQSVGRMLLVLLRMRNSCCLQPRDFSSSPLFVRGRQVSPSGEAMNSPYIAKTQLSLKPFRHS